MSGVLVGVDSSTQSCKVLVVDAHTGETMTSAIAPHPAGAIVDPSEWVKALRRAWDGAGIPARTDVLGVGVSGQQHGMVAVDAKGRPVHPALLWNDLSSTEQARRMVEEVGVTAWMKAVNVLPLPAITLTKLAWLREVHPEAARQVHRVMLPHDWLLLHLCGAFATDRSEASGTGYFSAVTGQYRPDLLERWFKAVPELPRVLGPSEVAGFLRPEWSRSSRNIPVSAGTGDNAGAALGLDLAPGEVVVSIGTSGTVFTRTECPVIDASGIMAGFADATGQHLPLLCTLNAARVLSSTAELLDVGLERFDALARSGSTDAGGLTMLPYFDGERTPNLPNATGELHGMTRGSLTPENLARAAVLAIANSVADCIDHLRGLAVPVERVLLIGGGAKSIALRSVLADTFGLTVSVPEAREYVAIGAARQACWAATGSLPDWQPAVEEVLERTGEAGVAAYRERYIRLRSALTNSAA